MVPTPKRKHKTLTIAEKCAILDSLKDAVSANSLAHKYGVGKSTITDLKNKEQKIRSFIAKTERGPGLRKTLKLPENPVLEEALFTWFLEQRRRNLPLSGEIVMQKARFFHKRLTGSDFCASRGWLDNFKKRHGICQLEVSDPLNMHNPEVIVKSEEDGEALDWDSSQSDTNGKCNRYSKKIPEDDDASSNKDDAISKQETEIEMCQLSEQVSESNSELVEYKKHLIKAQISLALQQLQHQNEIHDMQVAKMVKQKDLLNIQLQIANERLEFDKQRNELELKFISEKHEMELISMKDMTQ